MQLDNLSLAYLLGEMRPFLESAYVNKVSELRSGVLKIKLHTKKGSKDLILTGNALFLSTYSLQARHGKTPFAESLKKELYNKKIISLEQHGLDRVIVIRFLEHSLILEMLGEGNMILADKDGKIISCQKNEEWSDRAIRKGRQYIFPKANGINPLEATPYALMEIFAASKKDAIRSLINSVNVSPLIAEEVFFLEKMDKNKEAAAVTEQQARKISGRLKQIYSPAESNPVAYSEFAYPFRLMHMKGEPQKISSMNDYLSEKIAPQISAPVSREEKTISKGKMPGMIFQQKQQEEARKKFISQIAENQARGELIYNHYSEIEELRKTVLDAVAKGYTEKDIMYKIGSAASKGNRTAQLLRKIDLAKRKMELEF